MKKIMLFYICLGYLLPPLPAQEWIEMVHSGHSFWQIQNAMAQKYKGKSAIRGDLHYDQSLKLYNRWEAFWMHRTTMEGKLGHPFLLWEATQINAGALNGRTLGWTYLGPDALPVSSSLRYPGAGRVNAIAFDPEDTDIIWVGSPTGGLWKTESGGLNWVPYGDELPVMGVSDIAIDPSAPDIMYLASGDAPGHQNYSLGVLKSTDGGLSWNATGLSFPLDQLEVIYDLYLDHSDPSRLLAAASDGIYKTSDGGQTWNKVDSLPSYQVLARPSSADTLYSSGKNTVRISTDQGNTWTSIGPPLNGPRVVITTTPLNPGYILALDASGNLFKTHNTGASWTAINLPAYSSQLGYNMALAVSPTDTSLLLVGGVDGWRSTNGGTTWEKYLNGTGPFDGMSSFYVHQDHHVFHFLPGGDNILFGGNDGGLHKGDLSLSTPWEDLSQGLFITQYYGIGGVPTYANLLLAGARDNDVNWYNGSGWTGINNNSDGVDGMYNYLDTSVSYASSQFGFLTKTNDSWITFDTLTIPGTAAYTWPMAMNRLNPNTIYAGTDDLYASYDGGDNWTNLTGGMTFGTPILEIGLSPTDTSVLYTSYSSVLLSSTDHGQNWTPHAGPSNQKISGIAVSDADPDIIYVSVSGFNAGEKVFESTDGGNSWTNISGSLPNVPVNCIAFQSGSDQDLYVGADIGVYYRNTLTGGDFQLFNTNLPNVIVNDIEILYALNKIRIGTFGRGIWESDLASVSGQKEVVIPDGLKAALFPNPAYDRIILEINCTCPDDVFELKIYNLAGGVVSHENGLKKGSNTLSLSQLSKGVYIAHISSGEISTRVKFIKG